MTKMSLQFQFFVNMMEPLDFRLMFEHLPGVFFFVNDDQGRVIGASATILERLGFSPRRSRGPSVVMTKW